MIFPVISFMFLNIITYSDGENMSNYNPKWFHWLKPHGLSNQKNRSWHFPPKTHMLYDHQNIYIKLYKDMFPPIDYKNMFHTNFPDISPIFSPMFLGNLQGHRSRWDPNLPLPAALGSRSRLRSRPPRGGHGCAAAVGALGSGAVVGSQAGKLQQNSRWIYGMILRIL